MASIIAAVIGKEDTKFVGGWTITTTFVSSEPTAKVGNCFIVVVKFSSGGEKYFAIGIVESKDEVSAREEFRRYLERERGSKVENYRVVSVHRL